MKTLLSVLVAAVFAATGFNAVAQKDVTTKSGEAAKAKDGTAVKTKEPKARPKGGNPELPKIEKRAKKEKAAPSDVKTKDGGTVKSKDGAVNKK